MANPSLTHKDLDEWQTFTNAAKNLKTNNEPARRNDLMWNVTRAYVDLFVAGRKALICEKIDLGPHIGNPMEEALIQTLAEDEMGDRLAGVSTRTRAAAKQVMTKK